MSIFIECAYTLEIKNYAYKKKDVTSVRHHESLLFRVREAAIVYDDAVPNSINDTSTECEDK